MNNLTDKIADARRLDAEATGAPWRCESAHDLWREVRHGNRMVVDCALGKDGDFIAHARNHHAALWDLVEVVCKHGGHKGCDDGFYACPKSGDHFGRWEHLPVEERQCECGWDDISAALARLEQVQP